MNRRRLLAAIAASSASPLVAGCAGGGGDGGGDGTTATGSETTTEGTTMGTTGTGTTETTTTTTRTTTVTTTSTSEVDVEAVDNSFDPVRLERPVGATVTWKNAESGRYAPDHTVTSGQFHDAAADWEFDARIPPARTASYTFESAGIYEYYCTIHKRGLMCGVVLVGDVSLDETLPCE